MQLSQLWLKAAGAERDEAQGDADQPTEVRLLQAFMEAFRDPDHHFLHWWAQGVWLGVLRD